MTLPANIGNPKWSTSAVLAIIALFVGFSADRALVSSEISKLQQSNDFVLSELKDVKRSLEVVKQEQTTQSGDLREVKTKQEYILEEVKKEQ